MRTSREMAVTAETLRQRCAELMASHPRGFGDCGWLHEAFLSVPREHFVQDSVWWETPGKDGRHTLLDRTQQPKTWLEMIYEPAVALITQMDDGAVLPTGRAKGALTSSISSPGVIIELLRHLAPQPGDRVMEIGTGTGYTTALLATRADAEHVVTVEIDAELAARARVRLAALDLHPLVIAGDGELGYTTGGPYDRIVATASVRRIPQAWLDQLRPGGVLVVPLDSPFGHDLLVRLEGDGHGTAQGRAVERVMFMRVRGQRDVVPYADLGWPTGAAPENWSDLYITAGPAGQRIILPEASATPPS
ncbi:rRNA adenine N-6-methyltransferase family protein [Streptomyces lydicus]|uniref:rRNA adenine N-6-methyltransferase family protein n=1 Tax=Streptomyces lydicus TaxID=47763 RepID=UPI001F507D10|nr:rRNA adenine N-6-methyltransferase family protein [Streptomyces lydicus]MCZ1012271.1 protein-L-isoaspartate(D-aspartate) O-methyltransferase [Streptomyces lydicus]